MKNFNLSSNVPNRNWQILGERKLSIEASMDAEIQAWLMDILHSLHLHADLRNRILKSAQDSATRAIQAGTVMKFEHMHLMIFVPQDYPSSEKTWGFFRIEKVGTSNARTSRVEHSVEFYLYLEG